MTYKSITDWRASIQPITPLTIEPIHEAEPDWYDPDDVAERIARDIEQRGLVLVNHRRSYPHDPLLDHEVDEVILAVFRSCAAIARKWSAKRPQSVGRP